MNKTGTSWNKGKKQVWISNSDNKSKLILIDDLDDYISNGWERGRNNIKNISVHDSTKQKISKSTKGKTYEERYGKDKSQELKELRSLQRKNKKFGSRTQSEKRKIRLGMIKYKNQNLLRGGQLSPNYNKEGCIFFDKLIKESGNFIQHAENIGEFYIKELGYWVDGYDKENNIVYEYDESHHYDINGKLNKKDKLRQTEIENFLQCSFIRIKQK
jgi:hypothetical protein